MKTTVFILMLILALPGAARAIDCSLPCGPAEVITCAAQELHGMNDPAAFWDKALFDKDKRDGWCKKPVPAPDKTVARDYFHENYCQNTDTYYSYNSLIEAAKAFPTFLCQPGTSKETRYREFSNFLATIAQETTGGQSYTNDGLYFRFEIGYLSGDLNTPTTYGRDQLGNQWFVLNTDGTINGETLTTKYVNTFSATTGNMFDTTPESKMGCAYASTGIPLSQTGYTNMRMQDLLQPAYWIGMGAKQLTADSMMGYFGWYNQHLATGAPVEKTNFKTFVEEYLNDGVLAFKGAIWYWMKRVNGNDNPPVIADMFAKADKPVCHGIGVVTWMVNGGCNQAEQRVKYSQYFLGSVFHLPSEDVCTTSGGKTICRDQCGQDVYNYCKQ